MEDNLVCPKCNSKYVRHLAIMYPGDDLYMCGDCGERWGEFTEVEDLEEE